MPGRAIQTEWVVGTPEVRPLLPPSLCRASAPFKNGEQGRCSLKCGPQPTFIISDPAGGHQGEPPPLATEIRCENPSHFRVDRTSTPSGTMVSYPTLSIYDKPNRTSPPQDNYLRDKRPRIEVTRRSYLHLFDLDPTKPVTLDSLRLLLEERGRNTDSSHDLCPRVKYDDDIPLQAVWPTRCACFRVIRIPRALRFI